jgi:hypothetical protein
MRVPTVTVICALLLASAAIMFATPIAEADNWAPEITNVIRSQKYPMEGEVVAFNATVVDNDVIFLVELYICFEGTCNPVLMTDPDGDSVYGAVYTIPTGVYWGDYQVSASDEGFHNNLTDLVYFPVVHWINLTGDPDPLYPVIGDPFWVNGTAIYDDNNSAPAEQSAVRLEILETQDEMTVYVDGNGDYSFPLTAPSVHGSYNLNITVTNRTMLANIVRPLDVADIDTDGDGTPNNLDDDDDNDGLTDAEEDALGTSPIDPDTDDDGYDDLDDELPLDGNEWVDTDEDGTGNNADTDDDGDGVLDDDEATLGTDPLNPDTDGDTHDDGEDAFPLNETEWGDNDEDGIGDNSDEDDDNDGLSDLEEAEKGTDPLNADTDGDGTNDKEDYRPLDASIQEPPVDPFIWIIMVMVIVIVVIVAVVTLRSRRAPPE